jgi:conjugative transfer signal peptidase TraF
MPEEAAIAKPRLGAGERPVRSGRRGPGKAALLLAAALPAAALLATLLWRPSARLVWNASASSPLGLYRIGPADGIRRGDMAIAGPPAAARALGAERRYLPRNVPLVKRVAAAASDRVCARGAAIFVNGRRVAARRRADPSGRALPWWTGCESLRGGDLLLLSVNAPQAFDGRYFGISRRALILGRARLIWPR